MRQSFKSLIGVPSASCLIWEASGLDGDGVTTSQGRVFTVTKERSDLRVDRLFYPEGPHALEDFDQTLIQLFKDTSDTLSHPKTLISNNHL